MPDIDSVPDGAAVTDQLVPWSEAAAFLGRTSKTLTDWYLDGHVPAVRTPGGQMSTYRSFIEAVRCSPRPGCAGDIAQVALNWWAEHVPGSLREVA